MAALPYGVTLVFRLCSGVVDEVEVRSKPTFTYFQHYRAVNAALDKAALQTAVFLERSGFRAMPIPASQSVHDMGPYSGAFQHKNSGSASRAWLDWKKCIVCFAAVWPTGAALHGAYQLPAAGCKSRRTAIAVRKLYALCKCLPCTCHDGQGILRGDGTQRSF